MISTAKKFIGLTILFASLMPCAYGEANIVFERVNVKTVMIDPPEVRYGSSLPVSVGRRQLVNNWLMIVVEYTPRAGKRRPIRSRQGAFYQNEQSWADNVTLNVQVLFDSIDRDGKFKKVLFRGTTCFFTVKLDGAKHIALMFIPAVLFDRYYVQMPKRLASKRNRNVTYNSSTPRKIKESDLMIEATFSTGNQIIARSYLNVGGSNLTKKSYRFEQMVEQVPDYLIFKGAVLSKGKSPWAFYNINHFDPETVIPPAK